VSFPLRGDIVGFNPSPELINNHGTKQLNNHGLLQYICMQSEWSATASHVAMCLAVHRSASTGQCNPSLSTLVYETRLSLTSVRRGLYELMTKHDELKRRDGTGTGHRSSWYYFKWDYNSLLELK